MWPVIFANTRFTKTRDMIRRLLFPITALLLSDALLLAGQGLVLTLLPLRAEIQGFSATEIGWTGSAYFMGFVVSCFVTPHIVRRVGHIRTFAVLTTLYSAVILLFHVLSLVEWWLVLRLVVGFCICGLFMVIESWLNERSTQESRGTILSIYTVINLSMIILGQQLLNVADPSGPMLFGLAAILLSLAIIPVSLTVTLAPAPMHAVKLDLRRLWQLSHVGMGGAIVSGLVTGAFWSMGPLFARGLDLDTRTLTLLMSAVVLGGAVFQLPLGRLSDHYDRRLVLFYVSVVGVGLSLLMAYLSLSGMALLLLALFWGGSVMTLYAISLAHATDSASGDDFVMVGSGILLVYAITSALGGPLASALMALMGAGGLFVFSALCQLVFALGISLRRKTHVLPVIDETEPFRALTDTSPVLFEMDPRIDSEPSEENDDAPADASQSRASDAQQ